MALIPTSSSLEIGGMSFERYLCEIWHMRRRDTSFNLFKCQTNKVTALLGDSLKFHILSHGLKSLFPYSFNT